LWLSSKIFADSFTLDDMQRASKIVALQQSIIESLKSERS
jgi:hypothetical protein